MLRVNPFPRLSVPKDPRFIYDPDGQIRGTIDYLLTSLNTAGVGIVTIMGGYGYGKTHALMYIENVLATFSVRSFYVPSPGKGFLNIYRVIVKDLLDNSLNLGDGVEPQIGSALRLIGNDGELGFYARMWLLGERLPITIRMKLGVGSNIDEEKALAFTCSILEALSNRYKGVAILIDEFESLMILPRQRRAAYMELLRRLIDKLPPQSLLITALTPACWDEIVNLNSALARRFSSHIVYLRNLSKDELKEFLSLYVKQAGLNVSISELFVDEVLEYIYEVTNGNPGEVLKLASVLTDEIIMRRGKNKVSLDDAKECLANYV